ncbi:MAG: FmdB family zinc ribbon protein [Thermodesulfobacteriota bacterium]
MPIYEYYCHNCDYIFEELNKEYSDKTMECPVCGQNAKRLISNTSFILKGDGFYETDYKRKSENSGNGNGKESAKGNGNGEAKAEKATSSKSNTQQKETSSSSNSSETGSSNKGTSQDKD